MILFALYLVVLIAICVSFWVTLVLGFWWWCFASVVLLMVLMVGGCLLMTRGYQPDRHICQGD